MGSIEVIKGWLDSRYYEPSVKLTKDQRKSTKRQKGGDVYTPKIIKFMPLVSNRDIETRIIQIIDELGCSLKKLKGGSKIQNKALKMYYEKFGSKLSIKELKAAISKFEGKPELLQTYEDDDYEIWTKYANLVYTISHWTGGIHPNSSLIKFGQDFGKGKQEIPDRLFAKRVSLTHVKKSYNTRRKIGELQYRNKEMPLEVNEEELEKEETDQDVDRAYNKDAKATKETVEEEKNMPFGEEELEEEEEDEEFSDQEEEGIIGPESDSQPIDVMFEDEGKDIPAMLNIPDPYVTVKKNTTTKKQLNRICKILKCNVSDIKKNYVIRRRATKLYHEMYQEQFENPLDARDWLDKFDSYHRKPKKYKEKEKPKDDDITWLLETLDNYHIKLAVLDSNLKIKQGFREEYEKEKNKYLKADQLNNLIRKTRTIVLADTSLSKTYL